MRPIRIKVSLFLLMIGTVLLIGCSYHTDVSSDSRYSQTVKRTFQTKRPLEISTLNFPYTSYEDRHQIAAKLYDFLPKIGTLGRSHAVYFDRAIEKNGFDQPGLHYLEGHTTWKGGIIPVYYSLDFPINQHKDLGDFYKDFTPLK